MIVDASVILGAFLPDEDQPQAHALIRAHVSRHERLVAPNLLLFEVTNAVLVATRRERIAIATGEAILRAFEGLHIELKPVAWPRILALARRFGRSAYDAAYLALAEATGQEMITGDARLYHAARRELEWVRWIGDYRVGE